MNKDLRNMLVWMVFASALVAMAFWQAQVTVAQEAAARNKALPPPAKTRHAIRPAPVAFTGDPVADYIARCEKGLTDQEIGWILEDFRNAGLNLDWRNTKVTDEQLFALRASQHRWLHDLLVDGLRLSPKQSQQVAANLPGLLEQEKLRFFKAREPQNNEYDEDKTSMFVDAFEWFNHSNKPFAVEANSIYLPRNLCQLTAPQEQILATTMASGEGTAPPNIPGHEILPFIATQKFPLPEETSLADNPVFLTKQFLMQFHALHPAQFKTILLLYPNIALELQVVLNSESR